MRELQEVVLTKRDLEILQFVFEQRAVSFKQLAKRFFCNASLQAAHARVEKLRVANFLTKSYALWNEVRTVVYGISEKGIEAFSQGYSYKILDSDCKSDSVNHDLGLVVLRERIEKTKMVVNYFSESMLQNCSSFAENEKFREFVIANSDAALVIDTTRKQFQVALEYEISDKQEARYTKKLTEYYFSPSIALVLYVCGNARIEKLIRTVDLEVGKNQAAKVFTCLEETVHMPEGFLPFVNRNNAIFKIE